MKAPVLSITPLALLAMISLALAEPAIEEHADAPEEKAPVLPSPAPAIEPAIPLSGTIKEIEDLRQQLGPEFSIESKELEIPFQREGKQPNHLDDERALPFSEAHLDHELKALAQGTRDQARHLEELAYQADVQRQYVLADRLRELAGQKWRIARMLSEPLAKWKQPSHSDPSFPGTYFSAQPKSSPAASSTYFATPGTVFPASLPPEPHQASKP